jgi:hypothetical protein
LIGLVLAVRH